MKDIRTGLCLHCLGPRLDNEQFPVGTIFCPFDIHCAAIVRLDHGRPARQREDFFISQHGRLLLCDVNIDPARACSLFCVDKLALLGAATLLDNGAQCGVGQQRFEHMIFVGLDHALHDRFAQSPRRVDKHYAVKTGFGIDRKHHPGPGLIRADHLLDTDRQRYRFVGKPLDLAVDDGAVRVERGKAALACVEQRRLTADIKESFLLAGEARIGQVFGSRARPDSDAHRVLFAAHAQFAICGKERFLGSRRPFAAHDCSADSRARLRQR